MGIGEVAVVNGEKPVVDVTPAPAPIDLVRRALRAEWIVARAHRVVVELVSGDDPVLCQNSALLK